MKVKELKRILDKENPNANVFIEVGDEDWDVLDTTNIDVHGRGTRNISLFVPYSRLNLDRRSDDLKDLV